MALVKSRVAQLQDPVASNIVQAHPWLPPPLPGHQTVPLVCLFALSKDAAINYILCNCLLPHINVMLDGVHPTLIKHLVGGWINPLAPHKMQNFYSKN
jgi:hypothetical protein